MAATGERLDYYSVLKVARGASQEEIRQSYKSLAVALHPDKNPDAAATKNFQNLVEAYSILKDPEKRRKYDQKGVYEEEIDDYSDEDDYDDHVGCNCPYHSHHGGKMPFSAFFAEMFSRHYSKYGYRGFFDDEDDLPDERYGRSFWRKFGGGNGRFAADWSSFPRFPSAQELKHNSTPDRPSKPRAVLSSDGKLIKIEWAKKTPRKKVETWLLSVAINDGPPEELEFDTDDKSHEIAGPKPGAVYAFKVSAANSSGTSEWSEITTLAVPGSDGSVRKVAFAEEAKTIPASKPNGAGSNAGAGKKKAGKKKPAVDAKLSKLAAELDAAAAAGDKARIEKAVTAAKRELELPQDPELQELVDEAAASLQNAQTVLRLMNREAERVSLLQKLRGAAKSANRDQFMAAEDKIEDLIRKETDEDVLAQLGQELDAARDQHYALVKKQEEREQAAEELRAAMEERDLERLEAAIEEANRHSLPIREAKKLAKTLHDELEAAPRATNGDEPAAEEAPAEEEPEPESPPAPALTPAPAATKDGGKKKKKAQKPAAAPQPAVMGVDEEEQLRQALELSRAEYERQEQDRKEAEKRARKASKIAEKKAEKAAAAAPAPAGANGRLDRDNARANPPCRNLWVGNLSGKITEEVLRKEFAPYGQIEAVKMLVGKNCCFINFREQEQANNAKAALFGKMLGDRPMHIYYGKEATTAARGPAAPAPAPAVAPAPPPKAPAKPKAAPAPGPAVPPAAAQQAPAAPVQKAAPTRSHGGHHGYVPPPRLQNQHQQQPPAKEPPQAQPQPAVQAHAPHVQQPPQQQPAPAPTPQVPAQPRTGAQAPPAGPQVGAPIAHPPAARAPPGHARPPMIVAHPAAGLQIPMQPGYQHFAMQQHLSQLPGYAAAGAPGFAAPPPIYALQGYPIEPPFAEPLYDLLPPPPPEAQKLEEDILMQRFGWGM